MALRLWLVISLLSYAIVSQMQYASPAPEQVTNASVISSNSGGASELSIGISSNSSSEDNERTFTFENQTVNYYDNTSGYLVYPTNSNNAMINTMNATTPLTSLAEGANNKLPAVVMIHENRGLNEHI